MLSKSDGWVRIAEVNPPTLPDATHLLLDGAWTHVLVTDNAFGRIRVSPYSYSARITHDVPSVSPTVVISTRDRNILAIESEVRGAVGNGIDSFLVVVGDTLPQVEHLSRSKEIVSHLRHLQKHLPGFEVGLPTRFDPKSSANRIESGAQFLVAGPVMDPASVESGFRALGLDDNAPPVFLMVLPPFSLPWIGRMEEHGVSAASAELKQQVRESEDRRSLAWEVVKDIDRTAQQTGYAGIILMGLKHVTVVDEAAALWSSERPASDE